MNKKLFLLIALIFIFVFPLSSLAENTSYTLDRQALLAYINEYNAYFDKEGYPFSMNTDQTGFSISYKHENYGYDPAYDITIDYLFSDSVKTTLCGDSLSSELTDIVFYTDYTSFSPNQITSLHKVFKTWNFTISGDSFWDILSSDLVTIRIKHGDSISFLQ